jgi:uncharacterized membrane protein
MEELLELVGRAVSEGVEAIAILVIAIGAIEAVIAVVRLLLRPQSTGIERRAVWLDFARWLVAAMTFQLASDIIATSFSPNWDELGRLAAIAAIRTFLSYFLDREVEDTRKLQHPRPESAATPRSEA